MRNITLKINLKEEVLEFSDGYWLPMEYLNPNTFSGTEEWKRLYMRGWFNDEMFFKCINAMREKYGFNIDSVIQESGRWKTLKHVAAGNYDPEVWLYTKELHKNG
jgi:hypothetical protein